jgi:hypothetical protein
MKKIEIQRLNVLEKNLETVSDALNRIDKNEISTINWPEYPYLPYVKFAMAWDESHFYLKFFVREQHVLGLIDFNNGPVWEDSCCELFCAFDNRGYYNLETNCIGAQLFNWHGKINEKEKGSKEIISQIQRRSSLGNAAPVSLKGNVEWDLVMLIPVSVFFMHAGIKLFSGLQFMANFYKCGDKTEVPHFVSWNPIGVAKPDFHQQKFFGQVILK